MTHPDQVVLNDKHFELFIPKKAIKEAVKNMADEINEDFRGKEVVVLGVLDGAFMILSDLLKRLELSVSLELVKLKSYQGQSTTGEVKKLMGLTSSLEGKHIIVVEDIIDSGLTLAYVLELLRQQNPATISVATLLLKTDVFKNKFKVQYTGIFIPDRFVVGYGMDYDGQGRQLPDIYALMQ